MTYLRELDVKFTSLVTLLLLGPGRVNGTWLLILSWIIIRRKLSQISWRDQEVYFHSVMRRRNWFQCLPLFTNAQCLAWMAA